MSPERFVNTIPGESIALSRNKLLTTRKCRKWQLKGQVRLAISTMSCISVEDGYEVYPDFSADLFPYSFESWSGIPGFFLRPVFLAVVLCRSVHMIVCRSSWFSWPPSPRKHWLLPTNVNYRQPEFLGCSLPYPRDSIDKLKGKIKVINKTASPKKNRENHKENVCMLD